MRTDYKLWYVLRDNGQIRRAAVRFYEGTITTKDELDIDGVPQPVTAYRRIRRLQKADLPHLAAPFAADAVGKDVTVYTIADFGQIHTDEELREFLNKELGKDRTRTPIDEQRVRSLGDPDRL